MYGAGAGTDLKLFEGRNSFLQFLFFNISQQCSFWVFVVVVVACCWNYKIFTELLESVLLWMAEQEGLTRVWSLFWDALFLLAKLNVVAFEWKTRESSVTQVFRKWPSLKLLNHRFVLAASLGRQPVRWDWRMLTLGMPYFIVLPLLPDGPLLVEEAENIHCQSACLMDFLLIPSQITAVTWTRSCRGSWRGWRVLSAAGRRAAAISL